MSWVSTCPDLHEASGLKQATVDAWLALDGYFSEASLIFDVPLDLVVAVAYVESRFNPKAKSKAAAAGVMQLMPATRQWLVKQLAIDDFDPYEDPETNIQVGTYYLRRLLKRWSDRPDEWAIASYYAGHANVGKYGPSKYDVYVNRVLLARKAFLATMLRCEGLADYPVPVWPYQKKATPPNDPKPSPSPSPSPDDEPAPAGSDGDGLGFLLLPALLLGGFVMVR